MRSLAPTALKDGRVGFTPEGAVRLPPRTPSLFGLSQTLEGLILNCPCGLVSCRCRSWGSSFKVFPLYRALPGSSPGDPLSAFSAARHHKASEDSLRVSSRAAPPGACAPAEVRTTRWSIASPERPIPSWTFQGLPERVPHLYGSRLRVGQRPAPSVCGRHASAATSLPRLRSSPLRSLRPPGQTMSRPGLATATTHRPSHEVSTGPCGPPAPFRGPPGRRSVLAAEATSSNLLPWGSCRSSLAFARRPAPSRVFPSPKLYQAHHLAISLTAFLPPLTRRAAPPGSPTSQSPFLHATEVGAHRSRLREGRYPPGLCHLHGLDVGLGSASRQRIRS